MPKKKNASRAASPKTKAETRKTTPSPAAEARREVSGVVKTPTKKVVKTPTKNSFAQWLERLDERRYKSLSAALKALENWPDLSAEEKQEGTKRAVELLGPGAKQGRKPADRGAMAFDRWLEVLHVENRYDNPEDARRALGRSRLFTDAERARGLKEIESKFGNLSTKGKMGPIDSASLFLRRLAGEDDKSYKKGADASRALSRILRNPKLSPARVEELEEALRTHFPAVRRDAPARAGALLPPAPPVPAQPIPGTKGRRVVSGGITGGHVRARDLGETLQVFQALNGLVALLSKALEQDNLAQEHSAKADEHRRNLRGLLEQASAAATKGASALAASVGSGDSNPVKPVGYVDLPVAAQDAKIAELQAQMQGMMMEIQGLKKAV